MEEEYDNASTMEDEYADPDNIETLEEEYEEKIGIGAHLMALESNFNPALFRFSFEIMEFDGVSDQKNDQVFGGNFEFLFCFKRNVSLWPISQNLSFHSPFTG